MDQVVAAKGKVVVAMSGGVDSSVAACLLQEQGYDVTGLFMLTGTPPAGVGGPPERRHGGRSDADASGARAIADRLGIPFFALDFTSEFEQIIRYFADEYRRGRTPNPCVLCNERLKFGRLADYGRAAGAEFIATGHHARIDQVGPAHRLRRGLDPRKDQSYVLFGVGREMLPRMLLPIGWMTKSQVRDHARRFDLPACERPESQDICFAPDRDYARLVRQRYPDSFIPGPILDQQGREVGRHEGIPNFTIGQRRGVGVAMGRPVYVTRVDPCTNSVTIGTKADLESRELSASGVKWLIDPPAEAFRASVQIRYSHQAAPARVEPVAPDRVHVLFDVPQVAVTPGQAAVFYDADVVLGGGWIQ